MADSKAAAAAAPAKDTPGAAKPAAKKKNRKPVIIIGLAVLLVSIAAGAFFLLRTPADASAAGDARSADKGKGDKEKKGEIKKPVFVDFDTFTVNLKDPEKFLQIKLTFQVKTEAAAEGLKEVIPVVRSALIPVLSSQDAADLMTSDGKTRLAKQLVDAASQALAGGELKDTLEAVLITHMIIQ